MKGSRVDAQVDATTQPQLRFGAIADVQFADVPDAWNFKKTTRRRYRGALTSLSLAMDDWRHGPKLAFIADLGDIIDQQCESNGTSRDALAKVLQQFERAPAPVYHLVGNHELYNFNRFELRDLIPNIHPWYHSFRPAPGWRVVVLDAYDLNVVERGGGAGLEEAFDYLGRHNPNDLRAPRGSVDLQKGLEGLEKRFVPMAGAVGKAQLSWLADQLRDAEVAAEQVIMLTHVPVLPEAAVPGALIWNYEEVLEVIRSVRAGVVALVLAGHYHSGGYSRDAGTGTHHVTLESPLNTLPETPEAHCIIEAWNDRLEIKGRGIVPSRILALSPHTIGAVTARL